RNLVAALMALPEVVRITVEAAERLVDVPEETPFLTGEEERLLALHRVGSLVGHVERVAAQVAVRGLRRGAERFVGASKLLEHALSLVEQPLLEMLKHLLAQSLRLLRAFRGWHCYGILEMATRAVIPSRSTAVMPSWAPPEPGESSNTTSVAS